MPLNRRKQHKILAVAGSLAGHALVLTAMLLSFPKPAVMAPEDAPIEVSIESIDRADTPAPPAPKQDDPKPAPKKTKVVAPTKPPPRAMPTRVVQVHPSKVKPLVAGAADDDEDRGPTLAALSDADVAGAATAEGSGGGGGGGTCNMVSHLQAALRKDAVVQAAAAKAHRAAGTNGRALLVWNGDWLRDPAEAGHGLAGVREAIMVEVAFAPASCRSQPMHGLVLVSLNDAPGSARLALGGGAWRWTDLLH